jgi:hypothetical protein
MVDCTKKQLEFHGEEEKTRCLHEKADTYLQVVQPDQCEACPLQALRKPKSVPCGKKKYQGKKTFQHEADGYPSCPYRYKSVDGSVHCSITGLEATTEICHKCDEGVRTHQATTKEKVQNYFGAIRRWYALGKPTRNKEEIEKLFEENCNGCDRYDPEKHACKNCGCSVSTKSSPLANKLAMASEHCPLGRF